MVPRILPFVVIVLGAVGLFVFGGSNVLVGIAEQHAANHTYVVDFRHSGDDCGPGAVTLDVTDGEPLSCEPANLHPISVQVDFPGFPDARNEEIAGLAHRLGRDGLSASEQRRIQRRVDQIAATVPDSRRPHYDEGVSMEPLWGAGLAWTGAGAILVSLLVVGVLFWRATVTGGRQTP